MEEINSFKVDTLEKKTFNCNSDECVLDAALENNIFFDYSCKNGKCGVCKTKLISGSVNEIKPQLYRELKSSEFLSCCCSPSSNLLIDSVDLSVLRDFPVRTFPAKIDKLEKITDNLMYLSFRLPPSVPFNFKEGQYVDIIQNSVRRSYSVMSTSLDNKLELFVKNIKGGILSNYWFEKAKINDLVRFEGPKGTFFLRDADRPLIFLATGTGIAPIKSILDRLEVDSVRSNNKPIYLFWGNRLISEFIYKFKYNNINLNFFPVLSGSEQWDGCRGYVQDVALEKISFASNYDIYACGSENMINSAIDKFRSSKCSYNSFLYDAFVESGSN